MNPSQKSIVVIGGGISGLAAALRLLELRSEKNLSFDLTLLEASSQLGGTIRTLHSEGCILEEGADAIFTEKPWGVDFCRKLGLESEIIGTNPARRASFVAFRNRLHPVPEGYYLLAPARLSSFFRSKLFSWPGKLRIAAELLVPAKRGPDVQDESLASFVRRRLGSEALRRMAQPMVAGIYSADPEELSLLATFPRFLEWEREYGSVISGLRRSARKNAHSDSRGPRYGLFISLRQGMQQLVDAAAAKIPASAIRKNSPVESLRWADGSRQALRVAGAGFDLQADAVCLAVPAHQSARLLREIDPTLAAELGNIPYSSGIVANLIYRKEDVPALDGFGFVVPAAEGKALSGCSFSSVKFPGRAPEGRQVLRAFIGGKSAAAWKERSDADVMAAIRADLSQILGIDRAPLKAFVRRHAASMPQYRVGHLDLLKRVEQRLQELPAITVAGNAFRGIGIPDCVRSGEEAADRLAEGMRRVQVDQPAHREHQ